MEKIQKIPSEMFKVPKVLQLVVNIRGRGSGCSRCSALGFPDAFNNHPDANSRRAHVYRHLIVDSTILDCAMLLPPKENPIFNAMMNHCFPEMSHKTQKIPNPAGHNNTESAASKKAMGGASTLSCAKCGFRPTGKNVSQEKLDHNMAAHVNHSFLISCSLCKQAWHWNWLGMNKLHPNLPLSFEDTGSDLKSKESMRNAFLNKTPKIIAGVRNTPSKNTPLSFLVRSKTCQVCGFTIPLQSTTKTHHFYRWSHVAKEHAQSHLFSCGFCGKVTANDKGTLVHGCKRRHPSQACTVVDNRPNLKKMMDQCFPLLKPSHGQGKRNESKFAMCQLCGKTVSGASQCRWGHVSGHHSAIAAFACPLCLFPGHRRENVHRHLVRVHQIQNPKSVQLIDRRGELTDVYRSCFP